MDDSRLLQKSNLTARQHTTSQKPIHRISQTLPPSDWRTTVNLTRKPS